MLLLENQQILWKRAAGEAGGGKGGYWAARCFLSLGQQRWVMTEVVDGRDPDS